MLGRLWDRLEIGTAERRAAAGRRLHGDATERVIFALVAQRACEPGSKLAAARWVAGRVFIDGCGMSTSSLRCLLHTWWPVYRGLIRIARTANLFHAMPQRCRLRAGSCADGLGMPSR